MTQFRTTTLAGLATAAVLAFGTLTAAPAPAQANMFGKLFAGMADGMEEHGPCLAFGDKQMDFGNSHQRDDAMGLLKGFGEQLAEGVVNDVIRGLAGKSPYCRTQDPVEKMMLMGVAMDNATFHIGQGLVDAESALGLKSDLHRQVASFDRARNGATLAEQLGTSRQQITSSLSDGAAKVSLEIKRLQASGGLTPEILTRLDAADAKMQRGIYYYMMAGAGAYVFQDQLKNNQRELTNALRSSGQSDLTQDFLVSVPRRALAIFGNLDGVGDVSGSIREGRSKKELKKLKKATKAQHKVSRKEAQEIAELFGQV